MNQKAHVSTEEQMLRNGTEADSENNYNSKYIEAPKLCV